MPLAPPPPPRPLPPPSPHVVPHRMPSVRLSAARVGVQPAAELRHLQRHEHERHVLRALLPVPCPQSAVEPCPARCVHRRRPPPPALPARTSPRTAWPPCDSAGRKLLVQRQQTAHPLRVEGHLGLRLGWLWLELGSGKLPRLKIGCISQLDVTDAESMATALDHSPLFACGSHGHAR